MKVFGRFVHLTTLSQSEKSESQTTELCFWNSTIFPTIRSAGPQPGEGGQWLIWSPASVGLAITVPRFKGGLVSELDCRGNDGTGKWFDWRAGVWPERASVTIMHRGEYPGSRSGGPRLC